MLFRSSSSKDNGKFIIYPFFGFMNLVVWFLFIYLQQSLSIYIYFVLLIDLLFIIYLPIWFYSLLFIYLLFIVYCLLPNLSIYFIIHLYICLFVYLLMFLFIYFGRYIRKERISISSFSLLILFYLLLEFLLHSFKMNVLILILKFIRFFQ